MNLKIKKFTYDGNNQIQKTTWSLSLSLSLSLGNQTKHAFQKSYSQSKSENDRRNK